MKMLFSVLLMATFAFSATKDVTYQMIGGVPANNLCDNGNHFLTMDPVKVCVQWNHKEPVIHGEVYEPGEWTCLHYQSQYLSISKEKNVCLEMVANEAFVGCTRFGKGIQGNKTVAERVKEYGEASAVDYFDYYIPACKLN